MFNSLYFYWKKTVEREKGLLPFLLTLPSFSYALLVQIRNALYHCRIFSSKSLPCKVISIGNISAGGTGKTPFCIFMAKWLLQQGLKVAILTTGYKGRDGKEVRVVSDGSKILKGPLEAGEEAFLIAAKLKGIPVMAGRKRFLAGLYAYEKFRAQILLLDDGFQHLKLKKDLDILLVDAQRGFGKGYPFPRGFLREPLKNIERAHIFLITKVENSGNYEEIRDIILKYKKDALIYEGRFKPTGLIHVRTGEERNLSQLRNRRIIALSAIDNPGYFISLLRQLSSEIVHELRLPDHHIFSYKDLIRIRDLSSPDLWVIVTEKDGVKLKGLVEEKDPLWALAIEFELLQQEKFFQTLNSFLPKNTSLC